MLVNFHFTFSYYMHVHLVEWDENVGKEFTQQWEDDWDDDDVNDDFSLQLRKELELNPEKNEAMST